MNYKAPRKLGQVFTNEYGDEFVVKQVIMTTRYNAVYCECRDENGEMIREKLLKYSENDKCGMYYISTAYNVDSYFIEKFGNEWFCVTQIVCTLLDDCCVSENDNENCEKVEILYYLKNCGYSSFEYTEDELKAKVDNKELVYIGSGFIKEKTFDLDEQWIIRCHEYERVLV